MNLRQIIHRFNELRITKRTLRDFADNDARIPTISGRTINDNMAYGFIESVYIGNPKMLASLGKYYEKLKIINDNERLKTK